jgi:hypothetical protein
MGIKSTTRLPRTKALAMLAELRGDPVISNEDLGDELDLLVEAKCEREGRVCFDNYIVVDDDAFPERF